MQNTAIFFTVHYPKPGKIKPKIAAEAGDNIAGAIYHELIRVAHHHLEKINETSNIVIFYEPHNRLVEIETLFGEMEFDYQPMPEGTKAEIISQCFQYCFSKGYKKVISTCVDSPTLTFDIIEKGANELDRCDAVIGPAQDDLVYLLGLRLSNPQEVLNEMKDYDLSSFEELKSLVKFMSLNACVLNEELVIDTLDDWEHYLKLTGQK